MNRELLIRRLMEGDASAQELAWKLHRADEPTAILLMEENAAIVAEHSTQSETETDEHPTLEL